MESTTELQERIAELEAEISILDEMSDGVVAVNTDSTVIRYNKSFARMWSLPAFDGNQSLALKTLKTEMFKRINHPVNTDIIENLLAFDEEAADLLDIPLTSGRTLEQVFSRSIDTSNLKSYVWSFRDVTRQRHTRTTLHQKEQFLTRILHSVPMIIFAINMDGVIEFFEGYDAAIVGSDTTSLVGQELSEAFSSIPPEAIDLAMNGQTVFREDVHDVIHDTYLNLTLYPMMDEEDEQRGVIGIVKNVTQSHAEARANRRQRQMLNRIIYNAPIMIFVTDTEGNIEFSRGKLLNRYNMKQGQSEGKNFFDMYGDHPMTQDVRAAIDGRVITATHDFTMLDGGGYSETTSSPIRDNSGQIIGMVAVAVDVTDNKLAELEIEKQQQYLERVLSNAPIVMFATDKDGILTFSRGAELRQFRLEQNELVGQSMFPDNPNMYHPLQDDVRRTLKGHNIRRIHEIGEVYLDMTLTPLRDHDNHIAGMIGVGVNVTDIKRAQEAIEQAQELRKAKEAAEAANIAKTTFISNMSHELRTPLNSIIGFSQFLVNDRTLTKEQQEYVSLISRSSEHLLGLINDILEMSKIETGKVDLIESNFDLYELLEGMDSIYRAKASAKELDFELKISETVPRYLYGDRNKLRQILINLLSNAVKYTDNGGVNLQVWLDEPEHPDQSNQFHLFFEVEDTGLGIGEDELEFLFVPFTQTKTGQQSAGGSGLGLVITKQFAQLMGGEIAVESEEGMGSRFVVDVYMENASDIPATERGDEQRVVGIAGNREYKVLVVDDKWENRLTLVRTLRAVGFNVREASNGREAIKHWQDWQPDLIWMDMRMPLMNGYEATRKIREEDEDDVIIIALTASAFEHERREFLKAGCDDYMSKPFRNTELFKKMQHHLDVEFIYEEAEVIEETFDPDETRPSLSLVVALLDDDLKDDLRRAAINYSLSEVLAVTEKIAVKDKQIANQLSQFARDFDFGRILKALGNKES